MKILIVPFKNGRFQKKSILDIEKDFGKNSQNCILCRFVLYHLTKDDIKKFAQQAYNTLKPGGILCLEPTGYPKYQNELTALGFTQPYPEAPSIFKKSNVAYYKEYFLNLLHN